MLENFSSDDERLTWFIERWGTGITNLTSYEPWLHNPQCLAVRFEELYPELVALKDNHLGPVLRKMIGYLEVDAETIDPLAFYENVYGKSLTATDEEAKVGQYKRVFKRHHYDLLDTEEFRRKLDAFGYEW